MRSLAVSIGTGMIPLVAPNFFAQMPKVLSPILYSGILLASIMAVLLNAFFNGGSSAVEAQRGVAASAHAAEP